MTGQRLAITLRPTPGPVRCESAPLGVVILQSVKDGPQPRNVVLGHGHAGQVQDTHDLAIPAQPCQQEGVWKT